MNTNANGAESAAGARKLGSRLVELDCAKSTLCQQNRLRSMLEVRLRRLEYEHRVRIARITQAQNDLQERHADRHDRTAARSFLAETSVRRVRTDTACLDGDIEAGRDKCPCDCCRYGIWTGKNRPVCTSAESTPRGFSRSNTVKRDAPAFCVRRLTTARHCYNSGGDASKRVKLPTGAMRRSKTTI